MQNFKLLDLEDSKYFFYILPTDGYSIFTIAIVFIIGFLLVSILSKKLNNNFYITISIYLWHTLLCLFYIYYLFSNKGDSLKYFHRSINEFHTYNAIGSKFIVSFTAIFSNFFSFNYIAIFLIYNILGTIGLILLYDVFTKNKIKNNFITNSIILIIIFIPSLSFWSSAIGKDVFAFLSVTLLVWTIYNYNGNIFFKYFSLILMCLVRPHYGIPGIFIFYLCDLFIIKNNLKTFFLKAISLILILLSTPFILDFSLNYLGYYKVTNFNSLTYEGILSFLEVRSRYEVSDSFYDSGALFYPNKIFTLLFGPFIFNTESFFQFVSSVENTIILIILIYLLYLKLKNGLSLPKDYLIPLILYGYFILHFLSITVSNYGIANRHKWMVLPIIITIFLTKYSNVKYEKK